jgi:exosortase/archaeosortase family protein
MSEAVGGTHVRWPRSRSVLRIIGVLAAGLIAAGGLIVFSRTVTRGEAQLNGWLVHATGLANAHPVGSAVIFPLHGRWVGFLVTAGCSVVLPLLPPLLIASALVAVGRVRLWRAVLTFAVTIALLVVVNQIRLAVIVAAMRAWGYETGYERSHILIGSAITTLGLAAVAIIFLLALGAGNRPGEGARRV